MYSNVQEEVFEGIITAALNEYIVNEIQSLPSDEELAEIYPIPKKFLRKYKRKAKEYKYQSPITIVYLKRVAIVFLVIVSTSFGVLATNKTVRAAIADTVVSWYEKYIQIDFSKSDDSFDSNSVDETTVSIPTVTDLEISYIPSNYELSSSVEEVDRREYIYTSKSGDYMLIGIYSSKTTEIASDIELNEYEIITLNEKDAYLLYNKSERTGSLIYGNSKSTIIITSMSSKEDLIKVAENIK